MPCHYTRRRGMVACIVRLQQASVLVLVADMQVTLHFTNMHACMHIRHQGMSVYRVLHKSGLARFPTAAACYSRFARPVYYHCFVCSMTNNGALLVHPRNNEREVQGGARGHWGRLWNAQVQSLRARTRFLRSSNLCRGVLFLALAMQSAPLLASNRLVRSGRKIFSVCVFC